jgi:hypothetical protein
MSEKENNFMFRLYSFIFVRDERTKKKKIETNADCEGGLFVFNIQGIVINGR